MKKGVIFLSLVLFVCALCGISSCARPVTGMKKVTVLLDWTPNTNHTGVYVAKKLGFDKKRGLQFDIISGSEGGVIQLISSNKAEIGFSYQEEVTFALSKKIPVKAVATIFQHNTSGFASFASSAISNPKDFEGKRYGGFGGPSENDMIRVLMEKYKADFSTLTIINISTADFLTSLERGDIDFSWIFYGWDGIRAEKENIKLNFMLLQELDNRFEFYTPLLVMSQSLLETQPELSKQILEAIQEGYAYSIEHPKESAEMLHEFIPETDLDFLIKSQQFVSARYQDESQKWGEMQSVVWENFTSFLKENKIIPEDLDIHQAYSNEYLP